MPDTDSLNIIFWNIDKKESCFSLIVDVIDELDADICILAETPHGIDYRLENMLSSGYALLEPSDENAKIKCVYKTCIDIKVTKEFECGRAIGYSIPIGDAHSVNLVGCHLYDQMRNEASTRYYAASGIHREICELEEATNCRSTVMIGDFNMNPFETGMSAAFALNAVMDRKIAMRRSRKHKHKEYPYFYNPMWYFFGHPELINGTFYHRTGGESCYWNLLDQVLIRPELATKFSHDDIRIITRIKQNNLLNKAGIISVKHSDHLPIFYKLII